MRSNHAMTPTHDDTTDTTMSFDRSFLPDSSASIMTPERWDIEKDHIDDVESYTLLVHANHKCIKSNVNPHKEEYYHLVSYMINCNINNNTS